MSASKVTTIAAMFLLAISAVLFISRISDSGTANAEAKTITPTTQQELDDNGMQFGNFSISLSVKDIRASKEFYEKLDFRQVFGDSEKNFVIMQNGTTTIGLFQGMFEGNILTFNPGWDHTMETIESFQDVRDLQATLKERGMSPTKEADPETDGPESFIIVDPDGNSILFDQHVPRP